MPLPTLHPLWRPNSTGPSPASRDDRELIRQYAKINANVSAMTWLTTFMNSAADASPATVAQVQRWINEIEDLEQGYADQVADGTAHLQNVKSYEGIRPGPAPSRAELLRKADDLEWDIATQFKVRIETVDGAAGTSGGVIAGRIHDLRTKILEALGLTEQAGSTDWGSPEIIIA